MRLFVAVGVPVAISDRIETDVAGVLRTVLPGARWTRPEGRHLTLKFLGEVPDERVATVADAIGRAAAAHRPFSAAFTRVGGFPNLRRPRVLWVGIGPGAPEMAALAASVDEELAGEGFDREARPFAAHLTLARFKTPAPVPPRPPVVVPDEPFEVVEAVLFRSRLHPKGAVYTPVASFGLGAVQGAQREADRSAYGIPDAE